MRPPVALTIITALALILRLAWLANTDAETPPLSDPQYYHATAVNLADGRGYSTYVGPDGFLSGDGSEPTAFWAPGYSLAIAPLYAATGDDQRAAKALNAIAGALTVIPAYFLAARLTRPHRQPNTLRASASPRFNRSDSHDTVASPRFSHPAGLIAALLVAVAPAAIYWTAPLFSESLFTLGVATTLACAAWAGDRRTLAAFLLAGAAFTATAFVRSQGLVLIVPVAVLLLRSLDLRDAARSLVPVAAVFALAAVPWAVRNEAAMGRPYLINDNLGYNLRLAHAPYSTGTSVPPQDLWDERPGISFHERELLFDDLGRDRALDYALGDPRRELELVPKRVGWLLRSDAADAVRWSESLGRTPLHGGSHDAFVLAGDVYWYALLATPAISLFAIPRTRSSWALWSALAIWLLLHTVFAGEPRYHAPMLPVMAALAGAVVSRWSLVASRSTRTTSD